MKHTTEQRLRQLERLCGQLLAQNHRLIQRNAELLLEIHAYKRQSESRSQRDNVIAMPAKPDGYRVS